MSDYMRNRRGEEGAGEGFFCRFTFGQFFAILVLEVFTLFFVFYLGARYGREFLGLEAKQAVAVAEEAAVAAEDSSPQVLSTSDPDAARVAQELIQKAETPELKDRITKMFEQAQGTGAKTPEVVGRNRAEEQKAVDAPAVSEGMTPGERMKQAEESAPLPAYGAQGRPAAPDELPATGSARSTDPAEAKAEDAGTTSQASDSSVIRVKSADHGRYSVQTGSYPQMAEATRSVDRWKNKGYPAYMMIADIPDRGRWYRVRIGGFASREDASRYLKEFQTRENVEALIVMNEQ